MYVRDARQPRAFMRTFHTLPGGRLELRWIDQGELELETKKITLNYARSWFVLDLVASVPIVCEPTPAWPRPIMWC